MFDETNITERPQEANMSEATYPEEYNIVVAIVIHEIIKIKFS